MDDTGSRYEGYVLAARYRRDRGGLVVLLAYEGHSQNDVTDDVRA